LTEHLRHDASSVSRERKRVDLLRALLPDPGTEVTQLFRDEAWFAATATAVAELFDPAVESVPAWRGAGTTYSGIDGFREMWLDWLEPWASYHVQVEELFDVGDSVVVLVRDRARRHGMDVEVELISGSVWTFGNGKIVRVQFYANREDLREAVGLEP
jgi:ketosteroid isomerase-like protein